MGINLSAEFKTSADKSNIGRFRYDGQSTRPGVNGGPAENVAVFTNFHEDNNGRVAEQRLELNASSMNNMLNRIQNENFPWSDRNRADINQALNDTLEQISKRGGDPVGELIQTANTDPVGDLISKLEKEDAQPASQRPQPQLLLSPNTFF